VDGEAAGRGGGTIHDCRKDIGFSEERKAGRAASKGSRQVSLQRLVMVSDFLS
jgi:hypothetical protein